MRPRSKGDRLFIKISGLSTSSVYQILVRYTKRTILYPHPVLRSEEVQLQFGIYVKILARTDIKGIPGDFRMRNKAHPTKNNEDGLRRGTIFVHGTRHDILKCKFGICGGISEGS
jgi:hypothetical protein